MNRYNSCNLFSLPISFDEKMQVGLDDIRHIHLKAEGESLESMRARFTKVMTPVLRYGTQERRTGIEDLLFLNNYRGDCQFDETAIITRAYQAGLSVTPIMPVLINDEFPIFPDNLKVERVAKLVGRHILAARAVIQSLGLEPGAILYGAGSLCGHPRMSKRNLQATAEQLSRSLEGECVPVPEFFDDEEILHDLPAFMLKEPIKSPS